MLRANHEDRDILVGKTIINIKRGQLHTSEKRLSEKWGWSRKKVKSFLSLLENLKMATADGTSKGTTITIENYAIYQDYGTANITKEGTLEEPQRNREGYTNKNVKNDKNEKKREKNMTPPEKQTYREFVKMTNAEYEALIERLGKEGAEACMDILDNYKGSSGKKYKSDYRAILSWVIGEYQKRHPTAATRRKNDVEIDL